MARVEICLPVTFTHCPWQPHNKYPTSTCRPSWRHRACPPSSSLLQTKHARSQDGVSRPLTIMVPLLKGISTAQHPSGNLYPDHSVCSLARPWCSINLNWMKQSTNTRIYQNYSPLFSTHCTCTNAAWAYMSSSNRDFHVPTGLGVQGSPLEDKAAEPTGWYPPALGILIKN